MKFLLPILFFGVAMAHAEPVVHGDVVFKPTFLTGEDSLTAGTGFVARLDGAPVFLTAYHLFGTAGGLQRDLSPAEAKAFVAALAGSSMTHASQVVVSSEMILIPSAKAMTRTDASHDVAAFRLEGYAGAVLAVSAELPKLGEKVYLLARPRGEEKLRFLSAVVSRAGKDALQYLFDESGVALAGTSGAPVLNEKGEVVALNLGGGDMDGHTLGIGNPSISFTALIAGAKEKKD